MKDWFFAILGGAALVGGYFAAIFVAALISVIGLYAILVALIWFIIQICKPAKSTDDDDNDGSSGLSS